ncbi:MAG: ParB/RepB/Spo0J family partition protein [Candidatus Bathyarchaeia archaeon]
MKWLGALPIDSVRPNSWNVNVLNDGIHKRLKAEFKASGPERVEAITVRRAEDGAWEIVDGEQRWRIAKELGWKEIYAQEVDVDRATAKFLSLSYNALRGTVDYSKLSQLLVIDAEMVDASKRCLGEAKTKELMESGKKLTKEAVEVLSNGVKTGAIVSLEKIKAVAETPPEKQLITAYAVLREQTQSVIQAITQKVVPLRTQEGEDLFEEEPPEKEEATRQEATQQPRKSEGAQRLWREEATAQQLKGKEGTKAGKGQLIAETVDIKEPGKYAIQCNLEKRDFQVRKVKAMQKGDKTYSVLEDVLSLSPKQYRIVLKCDCGAVWEGAVDVETGEYTFKKASQN